jgi:multiple sugar transport system substrate-binding protein
MRRLQRGLLGAIVLLSLVIAIIALRLVLVSQRDSAGSAAVAPPVAAVEMLLVGDPFAYAMESRLEAFSGMVGQPLRLHTRRYARTLEEIQQNHWDAVSAFHLVSFDTLWLPLLAAEQVLLPLDFAELRELGLERGDFYPATLRANQVGEVLYGLPVQPHMELLWYRKDLLEQAQLQPPRNLGELLQQARQLHDPQSQLYGICWNALRGQALGQTVAHFYAAFGGCIVDENGAPTLDTAIGEAVLEYLAELVAVSPPDIFSMAWDQRIDRFARGQAVFTYGWTARAGMVERDPLSRVQGKVGYLAAPGVESAMVAVPFGQWSLGIPANIAAADRDAALRALAKLLSEPAYGLWGADGSLGLQRRARLPDHALGSLRTAAEILQADRINPRARPVVETWAQLAEITGTVYHDFLLGKLTVRQALERAQGLAVELSRGGDGD